MRFAHGISGVVNYLLLITTCDSILVVVVMVVVIVETKVALDDVGVFGEDLKSIGDNTFIIL